MPDTSMDHPAGRKCSNPLRNSEPILSMALRSSGDLTKGRAPADILLGSSHRSNASQIVIRLLLGLVGFVRTESASIPVTAITANP